MRSGWFTPAICNLIERMYGIRIKVVVPMRSVVGLHADRGQFICKPYPYRQHKDKERLYAIATVKLHIAQKGIGFPFLETISGKPLLCERDRMYTVEPWIEGRHANFVYDADRKRAIYAIARLHTTKIAIPYVLQTPRLVDKLHDRWKKARKCFLHGNHFADLARDFTQLDRAAFDVLKGLQQPSVQEQLEKDRRRNVLCHRDLAPHNIIIPKDGTANLIDYDLVGIDAPIVDLHQVLTHMSFFLRSKDAFSDELISLYAGQAPFTSTHWEILALLQRFPMISSRELVQSSWTETGPVCKLASLRIVDAVGADLARLAR